MADRLAAKDRVQAIQEVSQVVVRTNERCDCQDDFFEMVAELAEVLSWRQWCCLYVVG